MKKLAGIGPWALVLLGGLYCITTLVGVYRSYSPVPSWDAWGGMVHFYAELEAGNWSAWWSWHNEHRVIYSRIFFWFDYAFLGGREPFLLFVSCATHALTTVLFLVTVMRMELPRSTRIAFSGIVLALTWSWIQDENFRHSFQSQFFAVFAFAFLAFWFQLAFAKERRTGLFVASIVAALISTYSMANGIAAFPVLFLSGIVYRLEKRYLAVIAVVFAVNAVLYFGTSGGVAGKAHPVASVLSDPVGVVVYAMRYVGGPFAYATNFEVVRAFSDKMDYYQWRLHTPFVVVLSHRLAADVAGWALALTAAAIAFIAIRKRKVLDGTVVLLSLIAFVELTAAITGAGRLEQGISAALSSRYMTASLIGWVSVLLLCVRHLGQYKIAMWVTWTVGILLSGLLVFEQANTLTGDYTQEKFNRNLAALSVKLRVTDREVQRHLHPSSERLLEYSSFAVEKELSVFGTDWMKAVGRAAFDPDRVESETRPGALSWRIGIEDPDYVRVGGWVDSGWEGDMPEVIGVVNEHDELVGFGISGAWPRVQEGRPVPQGARWSGYALGSGGALRAYALGDDGRWFLLLEPD